MQKGEINDSRCHEGWKTIRLGEVVSVLDNLRKPINSDERKKRIQGKSSTELFPYYGATGQVGWIDDFLTEGEYILVGEDGAPFLDRFKDKAYKIRGKTWVNNHAHILKGIEGITLDDFILYYLNCINYREYVNGTTRLKLTKSALVEITIPVPSITEQHQIVSRIEELFSELDKSIEGLKTAQQQLKAYRQSVLQWAFEGKLGLNHDSYDLPDAYDFVHNTKKNQLNQINQKNQDSDNLPERWKWVKLGELIQSSQNGLYKPATKYGNGVRILRIDGFYDGSILEGYKYKRLEASEEEIEKYVIETGDILINRVNSIEYLGKCGLAKSFAEPTVFESNIMRIKLNQAVADSSYVSKYLSSKRGLNELRKNAKHAVNQASINQTDVANVLLPLAPLNQQQQIIQEIETRLSVADKLEETITQSLQQAEALRQSILKQAFEGRLIQPSKEVHKPKNVYFYQVQTLAYLNYYSNKAGIEHGEMTLAKYAYLADKLFSIPTYYDYKRWHLGPYPPEMKKVVKNSRFFKSENGVLNVVDMETISKYDYRYKKDIEDGVNILSSLFKGLSAKERSHETELLATVCKVIEDTQSLDIDVIRKSMEEWEIKLKDSKFKNKAEKFSFQETNEYLKLIIDNNFFQSLTKPKST